VEIPSWNALLLLPSLLALILLTINHTPLEPPPEPLELLEIPQFLLINHLTKTLSAVHSDGIVSTSLKDKMLILVLMILAVMSEMEVIASGILIPTLDLAEETLSVLISEIATLPLTAETQTTLSAPSTHVVVPEESVSPFARNKFHNLIPYLIRIL